MNQLLRTIMGCSPNSQLLCCVLFSHHSVTLERIHTPFNFGLFIQSKLLHTVFIPLMQYCVGASLTAVNSYSFEFSLVSLCSLCTSGFLKFLLFFSQAPSDWVGRVCKLPSSGLSTFVLGGISLGFGCSRTVTDLSWSHSSVVLAQLLSLVIRPTLEILLVV